MDALAGLLSAFGLSASAGLNAYVPLLIVALMARFTNWIRLESPWDALTSGWVIGALVVLGLIEFFADKVPVANHINDVLQTLVRPAAGAVLFAASTRVVTQIHPIVALIAGLVVAGSVHAVKAAAVRPAVTATTGGTGNIAISLTEDLISLVVSILSIVVPVVIAAVIILLTAYVVWWLWRREQSPRVA
ncbi:MAG: DUF4126 domain-containing protein [Anaerolineales bacterium]